MLISRLVIKGFRGIENADLRLGRHSVLVGPNNVGKTTVIEALALLFGREKMLRELTEHDFFNSAPDQHNRIEVVATLTDFDGNDPQLHRAWFGGEHGVEKWLDHEGSLRAQATEGCRLAVQVGASARFNVDTLEVETIRFFVDDDSDTGDAFDEENPVRPVRGKALRDLGFFLVSATRTWDRWISFSSDLFRKVIAANGEVPAAAVRAERTRVWSPSERLESADGIAAIVNNVNNELRHLMSSAPQLQLRLTSTDSNGVLEAVVPHFQHGSSPTLPASRQGTGLASLQSLLLLMQFGAARKAKAEGFLLAVEEPELHIPPAQQKRLVNRLNAVCTQTIMTTHSPLVASMFPPSDVIFLRNAGGTLTGATLAVTGVAPTNHEQHLFFAWRDRLVAALMHEHVLIPEGASDVAWLDGLQSAVELRQDWASVADEPTRFGTFVGVVPTVDAKVANTYAVAQGVHNDVLCVVDGDGDGLGYLATVKALPRPPRLVFVWPKDWCTEHVVGWIVGAGADVALSAVSEALGVTFAGSDSLSAYLQTKKSYAPVHQSLCEVIARVPACRARTVELLNDLADIARGADGVRTHFALWVEQSSATTQVWRLGAC